MDQQPAEVVQTTLEPEVVGESTTIEPETLGPPPCNPQPNPYTPEELKSILEGKSNVDQPRLLDTVRLLLNQLTASAIQQDQCIKMLAALVQRQNGVLIQSKELRRLPQNIELDIFRQGDGIAVKLKNPPKPAIVLANAVPDQNALRAAMAAAKRPS